uniref:40S ribosomal protein S8 n=1 Tax=Stygiella incarcerata TaxID=1712417 RepID=A0A192ZI74_9EUKA|nr:40S ribosomal protein S8-1 [Stygiella incarcerata]
MGISRDRRHKRRLTGGKRKIHQKKRKHEMGRPPANTKLGAKRVHSVRVRGGNEKFRAMRLDTGNFSWGSEVSTSKSRIIDVVYNATSNELVRTKTLVKNCIVQIDATPFRKWYSEQYGIFLGKVKEGEEIKFSEKKQKLVDERCKSRILDPTFAEQFKSGRLLACISSRPGQCGRADGYLLEGPELQFYLKKLHRKK